MADVSPTDIYIALMGVTGVGKSAFISHCTDQTPLVGDGLQSCTRRVQVFSFAYSPSVTVHLVDTPGFDDTNRKDSDVLREISGWLSESYTQQVLLTGILYLHRITDLRMQGSGKMSLALLHKLCGSEALKKVVLVTTMWDREDPAVGEQREQELATTKDFWGFYMQHGSQIRRHYNNTQSAMNIISLFVPQGPTAAPETITLDIQRELSDERKTLDQTGAGQILDSAWAREKASLQQELQEVREAMRSVAESRDATMARLLQEQQQEMDRTVSALQREQARLRVTMEQLHSERLQKMEEMLLQQRTITQSLTQDLERMRVADSDRQESQQHPEARQENRNTEAVVPGQVDGKAAEEALSARLLQESSAQAKQVEDGLAQIRATIASDRRPLTISGVSATGAGMIALGVGGKKDWTRYSVTKSGLSRWCDACRFPIGADVRYLCPICRVGYCGGCWRAGRGCKNRDHGLVLDRSGIVETSCRRLTKPPSRLLCDAAGCGRRVIEGLYFHCCCDGAELDFCRDCVLLRGGRCPKPGHNLQWGVVPISLPNSLPPSARAGVNASAGLQRVLTYLNRAWLEETDAPPRVFQAAARFDVVRRGRQVIRTAIALDTVRAQIILESYPSCCDYCMGPLWDDYECATQHPELGGMRVALCSPCHAKGARCPSGHALTYSSPSKTKCRRLLRPAAVRIRCDQCRAIISGLYLHCCDCGDNVDLCVECVVGGATCLEAQVHRLRFCYFTG